MASNEAEKFEEAARLTKAWKLVHTLKAWYPEGDADFLLETLEYYDDRLWDQLRRTASARYGKINPTTDPTTSCTVSRPVKVLVKAQLASPLKAAEAGKGVFNE